MNEKEQYVRDEANDRAIWGAIGDMREEQSAMKERMAVSEQQHREFSEWRKEHKAQMEALIASVNNAAHQYSEAQGAAKLGKWIISLLVAMGLGGWVTNHFMAGGPPPPGVGGG